MYNVFYRSYSNHLASDHKYELLENKNIGDVSCSFIYYNLFFLYSSICVDHLPLL